MSTRAKPPQGTSQPASPVIITKPIQYSTNSAHTIPSSCFTSLASLACSFSPVSPSVLSSFPLSVSISAPPLPRSSFNRKNPSSSKLLNPVSIVVVGRPCFFLIIFLFIFICIAPPPNHKFPPPDPLPPLALAPAEAAEAELPLPNPLPPLIGKLPLLLLLLPLLPEYLFPLLPRISIPQPKRMRIRGGSTGRQAQMMPTDCSTVDHILEMTRV